MPYTTINDGSKYQQSVQYSGNGGTNAITFGGNSSMQPDWVWIKARATGSTNHYAWDSSRGVTKYLSPSQNIAESADAASLTAFGSDGFTMGDGGAEMNHSDGRTYIGWGWKCNAGTTETAVSESGDNPGNTRQTNTVPGFSIIEYTGTGDTGTIAHGLGAVPHCIIFKALAGTENWPVYHIGTGNTHACDLNRNNAKIDNAKLLNDTSPTSSVFTITSDSAINADGVAYVAYAFKPIQGFSKFGSYTGNNSANGTYNYTGFKPAWVIIKNTGGTGNWRIYDNIRSPDNVTKETLISNATDAETNSNNEIDFLSNGFKCRATDSNTNGDGTSHIYMAFAEHPFVTTTGTPVTAR